jgi:hypothetical protein
VLVCCSVRDEDIKRGSEEGGVVCWVLRFLEGTSARLWRGVLVGARLQGWLTAGRSVCGNAVAGWKVRSSSSSFVGDGRVWLR